MKILEVIEEIRVFLREDFDVQTLQQVIAPGASLELLTALFPLLCHVRVRFIHQHHQPR
jgi:hypothetical protein